MCFVGSTSTWNLEHFQYFNVFFSDEHSRTLRPKWQEMLSEVFTSLVKDILFAKTEGIRMTPAACSPVRVHGCGESVLGQSDDCSLLVWPLPGYHTVKLGRVMQKNKHPQFPPCVSLRDVGRLISSWPEVERAIIKSTCTSISYVLSCFTGRPGWQVEEQTDRFLDRVVARACHHLPGHRNRTPVFILAVNQGS